MEHCSAVMKAVLFLTISVYLSLAEFTAVSLVDGEVSEYYDSNIRKTIPKTEWIKKVDADDPYYWYRETQVWNDEQEWLKHDVVTALIRLKEFTLCS
ncbi:hypothetical protein QTP70_004388 [Hemibagrus guttatus]|uniref:Uncharacterized protein n=1 Tax=Hemibagrus guttatus TaxID=175788 RepID=A0AAE0PQB1_9TELE|nr:hypothetical protein QTP70_004388 [Hemibagrus guttatus]